MSRLDERKLVAEQADSVQPQNFGTVAEAQADSAPEEVDSKDGVKVAIHPAEGRFSTVVIPGVGSFKGGERISKSQFNKLEKDARHSPTVAYPEGYPLLVKADES